MMNIKLSVFLLALLVPTKKNNNIKLKKCKHFTRKQKKSTPKIEDLYLNIEHNTSKMDQIHPRAGISPYC